MKVTVGVTGGVAAYKAAELVRALQRQALDVHVVMTEAAQHFIQPLTFASLTGHKVITSLWESGSDESIEHIDAATSTDALVVAPATANVLAKFAQGIADDFLATMYLATTAPVIVSPDSGYLAWGMGGSGRLAETETIGQAVLDGLHRSNDLAGETILITAGGTREAIDPVRFLGNRSSGKMGYALAEAALRRGARVILVSAPTALRAPLGCELVSVTTTEEMRTAVLRRLDEATIVIKAAAVADYRPVVPSGQKLKRSGPLSNELQPTEDILAEVVQRRREGLLVIGFAAETENALAHGRDKLLRKGADAIVLNDVSREGIGFDSDRNAVTFLTRQTALNFPEMSKRELANRILEEVMSLRRPQTVVAER